VAPGSMVNHARLSLGNIRIIDLASEVIERVLNFVGIPSWDRVVVSSEVRAKGAKEGLQFIWTSTVVFWVHDLELVF